MSARSQVLIVWHCQQFFIQPAQAKTGVLHIERLEDVILAIGAEIGLAHNFNEIAKQGSTDIRVQLNLPGFSTLPDIRVVVISTRDDVIPQPLAQIGGAVTSVYPVKIRILPVRPGKAGSMR